MSKANIAWARKFANASNLNDRFTGAFNRGNLRPPGGVPFLKGTPKAEPYTTKHEITKCLATWADSVPSVGGDQALDIRIYTPSVRLREKIVIYYEGNDNAYDPTIYLTGGEGPQWEIFAVSRNPESGRETKLKRAYPPDGSTDTKTLPDAYELDSAADILGIEITVNEGDIDTGAAASRVNLMISVTWEPNTEISQAELNYLYPLCQVSFNQILPMLKGVP